MPFVALMAILARLSLAAAPLPAQLVATVNPGHGEDNLVYFGAANLTCAEWLNHPENDLPGSGWVLGFFSGLNVGQSSHGQLATVGDLAHSAGIIVEVKKLCGQSPSRTLIAETSLVYDAFVRSGR